MLQNILVPLDGSARAEQALPLAACIARRTGGSLILLRVVPPFGTLSWYGPEMAFAIPDAIRKEHAKAVTYLQAIGKSEVLHNVHITRVVTDGEAADKILEAVSSKRATLMVMCSHGETGFERWMMGSVSRKVARQSPVPVLVLHPTPEGEPLPWLSEPASVRVVVPLDGSELSQQALEPASDLARILSTPDRGALHLICVLPLAAQEEDRVMVTLAQRYLAGVEQRIMESEWGKQLTLSSSISLHVDAAQAIVEMAEKGKGTVDGLSTSDIIAMVTHGRSGITRWMMGSITERVLDTSKLPMLIVRAYRPIIHTEKTAQKQAEEGREQEKQEAPETPLGVAIDSML